MKSWHLPTNLSAKIAPDNISEYLNFRNFRVWHVPCSPPPPPSMSRLGLSLCALTRPYCNPSPPPSICSAKTYKQEMHRNAPVSAVPLCAALFCYWYFISWGFIFAISTGQYEKKALNSRFKHFQLFRLSMETGPLQR